MIGAPRQADSTGERSWTWLQIPARFAGIGILSWVAILALVVLMSGRQIGVAPDDWAYLNYFGGYGAIESSPSVWVRIVEEPLWVAYAPFAGDLLGDEQALRLTIAISVAGFLYGSATLSGGVAAFVLATFVLDVLIGPQMYFNQIRQGVALSLFLAVSALGRARPRSAIWLGAGLAALVHTSFLLVLIATVGFLSTRKRAEAIVLVVIASLAVMVVFPELLGTFRMVEFGRRSSYSFQNSLNYKFYVLAVPQYGLALYLGRPGAGDEDGRRIHDVAIAMVITSFVVTFFHEAAARLFGMCNAMVSIVLSRSLRKLRGKLAAAAWLCFLVLSLVNEGEKIAWSEDSWLGRWTSILGR